MSTSMLTKGYAIGGVYMIRNERNKKVLIGIAYDFEAHRKNTFRILGKHTNLQLQSDFCEGHRFSYNVLYAEQHFRCSYDSSVRLPLIRKAREFIEQYDALSSGYNLPEGRERRNCQSA